MKAAQLLFQFVGRYLQEFFCRSERWIDHHNIALVFRGHFVLREPVITYRLSFNFSIFVAASAAVEGPAAGC